MPVQATERASGGEDHPRGDSPSPTLTANPYGKLDPQRAAEYENGYTYCLSKGTEGINTAQPQDWQSWSGASTPWREGFAQALQGLGLGRLASTLFPQDQAKASSMTTTLLPLDVFGCRDDEDNDEDVKIAFSLRNVMDGSGGAVAGMAGGGLAGGYYGGQLGAKLSPNPVGSTIGRLAGSGIGALGGGLAGGYVGGNLSSHGTQAMLGDDYSVTDAAVGGGAYAQGVEQKIQDALNKGLISKDEADAMRGHVGAAVAGRGKGIGGALLGGLGGAALGGLAGVMTAKGRDTSTMAPLGQTPVQNAGLAASHAIDNVGGPLARGLGGALAGGVGGAALGGYLGARNAGQEHVEQQVGDIISDDPSRADPQFEAHHDNPHWGRALVGAGLGALAGGYTGSKFKKDFATKNPDGFIGPQHQNIHSFALPGALAGAALGGYAGYSNPVTSTTPKTAEFEDLIGTDDEAWATELFKLAGMGSDIIGGGAGALAGGAALGTPIAAPLAAGVAGSHIGRQGFIAGHPELTDREKAVAAGSGGLGRGLMAVGLGGMGALAGSELGGMGADALTESGIAPSSTPIPLVGDVSAHTLGAGLGAAAGGLGAADLVGREGAKNDVNAHRARMALAGAPRPQTASA